MRGRPAFPDPLTPPLVMVVFVMAVLFGLVQRVARHIDTVRNQTTAESPASPGDTAMRPGDATAP